MSAIKISIILIILFTPIANYCGCDKSYRDKESSNTIYSSTTLIDLASQTRSSYLSAYTSYKTYAWGHDDLKPLSRTPSDWYPEPLLMTAVDALDGLILLGLEEEADSTREYIARNLSFDKDIYVKNFEITIRLLGSLVSSYQLTGDGRLLALARDLATRLLPAFDSPTGMPYTYVNLRTGEVRGPVTNPAEIGTLILEFGAVSRLTGDPVFYDTAKRALVELFERRSAIDLVGQAIDVETGAWVDSTSHISGRIDSYYEYLLKGWLLFSDPDLEAMWRAHIAALNEHLATEAESGFWYRWVEMYEGKPVASYFGALDAFFPAVLALSGDLERAGKLQASCYRMWNLHGLEPELIDFDVMAVVEGGQAYHLRPEIIESAYYLYHYTKDPKYLEMGERIFRDLQRWCRVEGEDSTGASYVAYAAVGDVRTKEKIDSMESFLFGETLKYLYLLFAEGAADAGLKELPLDFDSVIFTTEAHPIKKTW